MIWIGVDPGKKGAFAQIRVYGNGYEDVLVYPWNDCDFVDFMRDVPKDVETVKCAVEKVGAMPGQGVTSMFHFGESLGFIRGVLEGLGIPYQLVLPRRWKGEFGLIGKDKAASIEVCHRLFPDVSLRPTNRCRKDSDGMSDALCLAEFARRKM